MSNKEFNAMTVPRLTKIIELYRRAFPRDVTFITDGMTVMDLAENSVGTVADFNDNDTAELIAELLNFANAAVWELDALAPTVIADLVRQQIERSLASAFATGWRPWSSRCKLLNNVLIENI